MASRPDSLTHQGATRIAKKINKYWARKGKEAGAFIEMLTDKEHGDFWHVRSTMVGGRPLN